MQGTLHICVIRCRYLTSTSTVAWLMHHVSTSVYLTNTSPCSPIPTHTYYFLMFLASQSDRLVCTSTRTYITHIACPLSHIILMKHFYPHTGHTPTDAMLFESCWFVYTVECLRYTCNIYSSSRPQWRDVLAQPPEVLGWRQLWRIGFYRILELFNSAVEPRVCYIM